MVSRQQISQHIFFYIAVEMPITGHPLCLAGSRRATHVTAIATSTAASPAPLPYPNRLATGHEIHRYLAYPLNMRSLPVYNPLRGLKH